MANTTNFGWETPDDTDLVKDGAAAIRTLGSAIDTSLVDLKGGTTNQVLAKNSNTDMDFKWVADATGIPATIFDAKGDIIAATAADTADRLAVGANGTVLTADSTTTTGLKWATPSSGSLTELATGTLSGSSVTISSINQTYNDLVLIIRNGRCSVDDEIIYGKVNSVTSAYSTQTNVVANDQNINTTALSLTLANDSAVADGFAYIEFFDYAQTSTWKLGSRIAINNNSTNTGNMNWARSGLLIKTTEAISSIILTPTGGTMSGTYILYGRK